MRSFTIPVLVLLALLILPQWGEAGAGHNLSGYAWSSTIGWVSFNSTTSGGSDYGVNVAANGIMSGYAWSPNIGWISFNSSDLSGCPSGSCSANFDKKTGAVSGWARARAGTGTSAQTGDWGGWIQLAGANHAVSVVGCEWQGEAWGGGSSLQNGVIGWLSFKGTGYGVVGTGDACAPNAGTDLTAGSITPTTALVGTAVDLTGTVSNTGASVASASRTYFRVLTSGGSLLSETTVSIPAIQPGAGNTSSYSYKFTSAGNYQAQVCADWFGAVAETNEANNCGPLTTITVSASASCSVSSTSVSPGGSVTYTATPSGTTPYTWTSPDGTSGYGSAATATRTFTTSGDYAMQVASSAATVQCPVVIVSACPGTSLADITATPNRVTSGNTSVIAWTASGINTSCTITGPGLSRVVTATSCAVPSGSATSGPITSLSTYSISCDNGKTTAKVIVNVVPKIQEF